jgi:hypothetical protein
MPASEFFVVFYEKQQLHKFSKLQLPVRNVTNSRIKLVSTANSTCIGVTCLSSIIVSDFSPFDGPGLFVPFSGFQHSAEGGFLLLNVTGGTGYKRDITWR